MPTYRQDWERRHGAGGPRWEDVEPAYQFAYTNYHDPAYQNLTWTDAEPRLRPAWEMRYPDRPWSRARMYVQDEWDHLRGTT
jgi:hypothetical protein